MKALLLFTVMLLFTPPTFATTGHWVGNGGDSMALGIYTLAKDIGAKLEALTPECAARLDLNGKRFAEILDKVQIETSIEPLFLEVDGQRFFKEAINYPDQNTILFHRDSYNSSQNHEQLIIHEFLGLAGIPDDGYRITQLTYQTLHNPNCLGDSPNVPDSEASNALQNGEVPYSSAIDKDGMLYFLLPGHNRIYRYSVPAASYVAPLETLNEPKLVTVSESQRRIYFAYDDDSISYFDLRSGFQEHLFVKMDLSVPPAYWEIPGQNHMNIQSIQAVGSKVVVVPARGGSSKLFVYLRDGRLNKVFDQYYESPFVAKDDNRMRFYFLPRLSPQDLSFFDVNEAWSDFFNDSPYHGEYPMSGPIVVSPTLIALGSGNVFSNPKLEYVTDLSGPFDMGTWVGKTLFVARSHSGGLEIEGVRAPDFTRIYKRQFESAGIVAMYAWNNTLVLIYTLDTGELKIETVSAK